MEPTPETSSAELLYQTAPVFRAEHGETRLTRLVEQQSAKVPSLIFLGAALGSMVAALAFELAGRRRLSRFVGLWPGPLLTMGVYNKLVKTFGAK